MVIVKFFGALLVFCIPAALASWVAAMLIQSSRGTWKVAVCLPVVPLALWGPAIAWDVTRDPTSHNLWPFELVMWGIASLGLLGMILLARLIAGGRVSAPARRQGNRTT